MPLPRQRIVFCDCLDCTEPPAAADLPPSTSAANEAAARQEPPPKCLFLLLSGALAPGGPGDGPARPTVLEGCRLPHLDRATAEGCLTLVASRQAEGSAGGPLSSASLHELEQLLGRCQPPPGSVNGAGAGTCAAGASSLPERFKGLQVVFASSSPRAAEYAASLGCSPAPQALEQLLRQAAAATSAPRGAAQAPGAAGALAGLALDDSEGLLPDAAEAARAALELLGLRDPTSGPDMLLLHLEASCPPCGPGGGGGAAVDAAQPLQQLLAWCDRVVRYLHNEPLMKEAVLLVVLLTPPAGAALPPPPPPPPPAEGGSPAASAAAATGWLQPGGVPLQRGGPPGAGAAAGVGGRVLRPLQSWQVSGGAPVEADVERPLLCLRRLPGVVRRDGCVRLGLGEAYSRGGMGPLLLERLLPELAYKMGRAPKYGA